MVEQLSPQPYRGTRDFFPEEMQLLSYIFSVWRSVATTYGYEEYLSPLLEEWQLYASKNVSGEEIVNEQLYWFADQSGRKVAIRPEMTPSVSRMVAAKSRQLPKPLRWFSIANFMRYERPQHGRAREFFQLNVDVFGEDSVLAEAEMLEMAVRIMQKFGATEKMFTIYVNNRVWFDYWIKDTLKYDGETKALSRIVDRLAKQSPEETTQQLQELGLSTDQIEHVLQLAALTLADVEKVVTQNPGAAQLIELFGYLRERGLLPHVTFNAALVRGLDYYTGNVFEQFDLHPENRRSMFGGGRYDGLVSLFGGEQMPAVGFAPGDLTTQHFLRNWNLVPDVGANAKVLVTVFDRVHQHNAWQMAQMLRDSGIKTELYIHPEDKLTVQLRYADRKKIPYVVIIGPEEIAAQTVQLKDLLTGEQKVIPQSELGSHFTS